MNAKEQQKEDLIQKPCFQFQDEPKLIILCEKCGELIGTSLLNAGQICETRSIFVRFKEESSPLVSNVNVCGRRLLDLFSTFCSRCEYDNFHLMDKDEREKMERPKFQ
jgi:hypothetical protein